MDVDLEELAAIIEQLDKTEFTDFLYEQGSLRIHVRRGGYFPELASQANGQAAAASPAPGAVPAPAAAAAPTAPPTAAPPTAAAPAAVTASAAVPPAGSNGQSNKISPDNLPAGRTLVTAPMLGTFYGAPKPGEPAFVQVGDTVTPDSVLCIVEVMKLMNSVAAGAEGEIAAVFVQDGELVEFEQPLFAIRAAS
ncbi:acetyl-CoA carboxylase, biotin carboxyl carrier protein [Arthrobacter sp. CAU 1506]|uniref:acetyl-CoA carboxylase biotin carboxyl carrier protein n=1 Tax=Arthrobacter sp. CAU 1506 TaxID=2560052 RepID=UPI0010AC8A9C|nr:biotin/lipoyl-containing protein [Arthrobacter sp. CAU 1506]TJY68961.1 acetyl-CoA carboxylase, biotin carboxyl carrier protein [Arthrobacter sp. CAU 1506]